MYKGIVFESNFGFQEALEVINNESGTITQAFATHSTGHIIYEVSGIKE